MRTLSKLACVSCGCALSFVWRVVQKVLRDLQRLHQYYVLWMNINSEDMGEPVGRPRYYFLLIRYDACIFQNMGGHRRFLREVLGRRLCACEGSCLDAQAADKSHLPLLGGSPRSCALQIEECGINGLQLQAEGPGACGSQ